MRTPRYHLLDSLRWLAFAVILIWHYVVVLWYDYEYLNDVFFFHETSSLWALIRSWLFYMAFSGFIIVSLSSFLSGLLGQKVQSKKFLAFFMVGALLFFSVGSLVEGSLFLEWDIYPFLIASFLSCTLFTGLDQKRSISIVVLGFALTLIPFWKITFMDSWPLFIKGFLIGDCNTASGQWPLLPWVGLVWMFFGMGKIFKRHGAKNQSPYLPWHKYENWLWPVLLCLSIPAIGSYFQFPADSQLDCRLFRLKPWEFWGQMIFFLFFLRLGLLEKVNIRLSKLPTTVGHLQTSKNFWLVYVLHYPIIFIAVYFFGKFFRSTPYWAALGFVSIYILTELIAWWAAKRLGSFGRPRLATLQCDD